MKKQLLLASMMLVSVFNHAQAMDPLDDVVVQNPGEMPEENQTPTEEKSTEEKPVDHNEKKETVAYTIQIGDTLYASPRARFEIQGIDEQSGLKEVFVSLDGQEYTPYKHPIAFYTEGNHSLTYQFIDRVGNISYSKNFDLVIDATAPRILEMTLEPKAYHASGSIYVSPKTMVSFMAHDDLTGLGFIEYSTNEQDFVKYSDAVSFANLGYTNNSVVPLYYRATDAVSNVSAIKLKTITVDATPPTLEIFNIGPVFENQGVRYVSSRDMISIEAFDKETKVDQIFYAINDGEFQVYNSKIGINLKESGQYKIRAKATDIVGNESEEITYEVVVDMTPPNGSVDYLGVQKSDEYKESAEEDEPAVQQEESAPVEQQAPTPQEEPAAPLSQETNPGDMAPVSNS